MAPGPAKYSAARAFNAFGLVSFVVGAKAANVINVAMTFNDARGGVVATPAGFKAFLASNAAGTTLTPTATTSALAVGTNGTLLDITTTGKCFSGLTDSLGRFDVNITQTASPTAYYLVVIHPSGLISVSPLIQF
jgi:hypothetical protein